MEEDVMGGVCSTQEQYKKCIQNLGWKIWRERDI